jgi:hypothetical protein
MSTSDVKLDPEQMARYLKEAEGFFDRMTKDAERWALSRRIAFGAIAIVAAIALVAVPTLEYRVSVLIGMAILMLCLPAIWPALAAQQPRDAIVLRDAAGKPRLAIGVFSDIAGIHIRGPKEGQSMTLFSGEEGTGLMACGAGGAVHLMVVDRQEQPAAQLALKSSGGAASFGAVAHSSGSVLVQSGNAMGSNAWGSVVSREGVEQNLTSGGPTVRLTAQAKGSLVSVINSTRTTQARLGVQVSKGGEDESFVGALGSEELRWSMLLCNPNRPPELSLQDNLRSKVISPEEKDDLLRPLDARPPKS